MLTSSAPPLGELENPTEFIARHIGISDADEQHMLGVIGEASRRALIESIVPRSIARAQAMQLPAPVTEAAARAATIAEVWARRGVDAARELAGRNIAIVSLWPGLVRNEMLDAAAVRVADATTFLEHLMPKVGHVMGPPIKKRRWEDAQYGFNIAKESSRLDIGQTVVVKNGTVLAVEAFEGTNEAVKRGGAMGRGAATMVKVSKPNQDMRFDVPVIGPDTIRNAASAGIDLIAVEAEKTLLLGFDEIQQECQTSKITIIAIS